MADTEIVARGTVARDEVTTREIALPAETQATAVAAQAQATVQARYAMALRRPRDMDHVRVALMKECERPTFAQVARYRKPIGKGVEGPSIRFAEAAIRCMGNVVAEQSTVYDDDTKRIVRVTVTELESNVSFWRDVTVDKTVERSVVKEGTTILRQRQNSQGRITYTVSATDDDLLNKEGALVSKAIRTLALRIIPGDLVDEAMSRVKATLLKGATADPDSERKKIADAFAALGVLPAALKEYLGHDLGQCSPAELIELRATYSAIRDGEATWAETMEAQRERAKAPAEPEAKAAAVPAPEAPAPARKSVEDLKREAKAKQEPKA